ncbi:MAG: CvpA family protein [Thermodesulfobacteriota bacterium]
MNLLDITVIVIAGLFLARGLWVGFVRQLAFLLALFFSYILAGRYHQFLFAWLTPFIDGRELRLLVAYGLTLFGVYVAVILVGFGVKKVMQVTCLSWFDRSMGGVFGLVKAGFLLCMLYLVLANLLAPASPLLRGSQLAPYLKEGAAAMLAIVQDEDLRREILPKLPAIPEGALALPAPVERPEAGGRDAAPVAEKDKAVDQRRL